MSEGLTVKVHPTTFSAGQLGDLATLADAMRCKSPCFSALLQDWIEREQTRRSTEPPLEPRLLKANAASWTDSELADAAVAACISCQISDDSSLPVRSFLQQLHLTIVCWAAMRLKNRK
jgi:hypothetical protein